MKKRDRTITYVAVFAIIALILFSALMIYVKQKPAGKAFAEMPIGCEKKFVYDQQTFTGENISFTCTNQCNITFLNKMYPIEINKIIQEGNMTYMELKMRDCSYGCSTVYYYPKTGTNIFNINRGIILTATNINNSTNSFDGVISEKKYIITSKLETAVCKLFPKQTGKTNINGTKYELKYVIQDKEYQMIALYVNGEADFMSFMPQKQMRDISFGPIRAKLLKQYSDGRIEFQIYSKEALMDVVVEVEAFPYHNRAFMKPGDTMNLTLALGMSLPRQFELLTMSPQGFTYKMI